VDPRSILENLFRFPFSSLFFPVLHRFYTRTLKNAPTLYSEAEILLFIRTGDDKSALAISVYPNDEAREAGKKRAASRVSENFEPLFKDTLRLSGKVMTKHIQQK